VRASIADGRLALLEDVIGASRMTEAGHGARCRAFGRLQDDRLLPPAESSVISA
jgi:hypothetical protein